MTYPLCVHDVNGKKMKKNDINNIECDVFNGSDRYSIIGIDADTQTILDTPIFFNESLLTLLVSMKQNSLMICQLLTLTLTGMNYSKLVGRKWVKKQEDVLSVLMTM